MVTEDNYINWPKIFVFLAFEQTMPAFQEFDVPYAFLFYTKADAFRRVIRDFLPEIIHFENRDLNHYPGIGDEDYVQFWSKLENLLAPMTKHGDVRNLRKWGNNIRLLQELRYDFIYPSQKFFSEYRFFRRSIEFSTENTPEEAFFLTLSHMHYWRQRASDVWFETLITSVNQNTKIVEWVNSIYPEREWYKPSATFMEDCLTYMWRYSVVRIDIFFAQSLRNTFTRDRYESIITKLIKDEEERDIHLKIYDLSNPIEDL
jgi:hypothetical protein